MTAVVVLHSSAAIEEGKSFPLGGATQKPDSLRLFSQAKVTPGLGPAQAALFRRGDFGQCGKGNTDTRTQAIDTLDAYTPVISLDDCLAD